VLFKILLYKPLEHLKKKHQKSYLAPKT
jgi:hypothetical protein